MSVKNVEINYRKFGVFQKELLLTTRDSLSPLLHKAKDILGKITSPNQLERVVKNKGFKKLKVTINNGNVMANEIELDGLTDQLKMFYEGNRLPTTGGLQSGGSTRGMTVDVQLQNLINKGILAQDVSPFTKKLLIGLQETQMRPFYAQVPVGDEDIRIGTALDLLCIDMKVKSNDNVVVIQVKTTGNANNYDDGTQNLLSPITNNGLITNRKDTLKTRHILQTAFEHYLSQKTFDKMISRSETWVIFDTLSEPQRYVASSFFPPDVLTAFINEMKLRLSKTSAAVQIKNIKTQEARKKISKQMKTGNIVKSPKKVIPKPVPLDKKKLSTSKNLNDDTFKYKLANPIKTKKTIKKN